jgi:membrane protease YdiL (CAAX protease family)
MKVLASPAATTMQPHENRRNRLGIAIFAGVTALVSLSVHGFWRGIVPGDTAWLIPTQLAVLAVLLGYAAVAARSLRGFVLVNLALHASNWVLFGWIAASAKWAGWFGSATPPMQQVLGEQVLKLVQMLVVIGVLLLLGLRRHEFYLATGQTNAPVEPVRWLGIRRGATWTRVGSIIALVGCLLLAARLVPAVVAALASGGLLRVLPFLPAVLLFAASNAIYEEVVFKAAPLSQLAPLVGRPLALLLVAAMFGLGHFTERYFLPGTSVIFPALLGYLLGKSMLETRGIVTAWRIHFAMDVLIFSAIMFASVGQH